MVLALYPDGCSERCRSLEDRFRLLRFSDHKVADMEWDRLPAAMKKMIPGWIGFCLHASSRRRRIGVPGPKRPYVRQFAFFGPSEYEKMFQEGSLFLEVGRI